MRRCGEFRTLIGPILLLLIVSIACSRPAPQLPSEDTSQAGQTPFENPDQPSTEGAPQTAALIEKTSSAADLPFRSSNTLPAGSLVTVRLKSTITAAEHRSGESFTAIVDEPVILEGNAVIPRGTIVSGRVGSAHIPAFRPDRGYVRLGLESVNVDGFDLPVQTATLFARQISGELHSGMIRLEKGRRLTFQLSEPFFPGLEHASASH